ncbi:hypothetical protein J1N35_019061 [Gossypium stocksii]|uniref:Uncharacterized protein n=1 Tax=Gossypium stocksii TaxID=47602 RepID=A0A9D3VQN9_9ROSI|nr:hypothetical protein J1N35_019061 [Gossypium stocksii]
MVQDSHEQLSSVNRDSRSHWSYYSDYKWHEYSYEHPHGSYEYVDGLDSYNPEWSTSYPKQDSYSSYYYLKSNMKSDKYMEDPSLATWVGILEECMSSCQATVSSMFKMLEQILEVVQCRATLYTLIDKVEHDILEL